MTFNMNGGQFNLAKYNATINATQNNSVILTYLLSDMAKLYHDYPVFSIIIFITSCSYRYHLF